VVSGSGGQFLYNTTTGGLFWDADGTGVSATFLLATLQGAPSLSASDFLVVDGSSAPLMLEEGGVEELADAHTALLELRYETVGRLAFDPLYPALLPDDAVLPPLLARGLGDGGHILRPVPAGGMQLERMEEPQKTETDGSPEILPAFALDSEALIGGWEGSRTFDARLVRELMLTDTDAKLADASPQILVTASWQDETGPWLDHSAGGGDGHAAAAPGRAALAGLAPHTFGPHTFDPIADLARKGLVVTPEWSALEA
jgi:hypothetical protein